MASNPNAIFGTIDNPLASGYGGIQDGGLVDFVSNVVRLIIVAGGVWALLNLVFAGIQFIGSSGDPEATKSAWKKIYMSLLGLAIMVASYALAVIVSLLLFGSPTAILSPTIVGPGSP